MHKITIRWGKDPEYWEVKSYEFETEAELAAFRLGVDEAYQELDAVELENEEEQSKHDHCEECGCVLTSHESEQFCRWCEERMAKEKIEEVTV